MLIENSDRLIHARTFREGSGVLKYVRQNGINLALIDPGSLGGSFKLMEFFENKPQIVIASSTGKYALEGFKQNVVDYLLPDVTHERFQGMIEKVTNRLRIQSFIQNKAKENIFVRSNYKTIKITLNDIEYIESVRDYVIIYQTEGNPVMSLMTLKMMVEGLPAEKFRQIHRSYIVAVDKIKSIRSGKIQLTCKELPIADTFPGFVDEWESALIKTK